MRWRAQPHETFLGIVLRSAVGSALAGLVYSAAMTGRAQPATTPAEALSKLHEVLPRRREQNPPFQVLLLRPRVKLDYLSSRGYGRIWNAVGLPCRGAKDRTSCDAAILDAEARAPLGPYLLGTRGDDVQTWVSPEEFLALVGRIEDVPTATEYLRSKQIARVSGILKVADGFVFETRETTEVIPTADHDIETGTERGMQLSPDGTLTVRWTRTFRVVVPNIVIEGRRPPGLVSAGPRGCGLGAHFARAARDEAASVDAFTILGAELRAHGAPVELAQRCEAAAEDEVRHAEQASRLARRFGHEPSRAALAAVPLRSLRELAFDNAVEGCVHETYAALIAVYQAHRAEDPEIAVELSAIAQDETRHAALSWDIDLWLRSRLTSELQAAVARAQREAAARLVDARHFVEDERERRLAGLPGHAHCRQMIDFVTPHLWSA